MRKLLVFTVFFLYACIACAQQTVAISGIVTDVKDQPIPGATVFIENSRIAAGTDVDGKFILKVQPGKYNLLVKMMGYVLTSHEVTLQNKDVKLRFKLAEDNLLLNTANISGVSKADRRYYLGLFLRCFFGTSYQARFCKIENPDIIVYNYNNDTQVLTAHTDDFLLIENKALGYRIKYLLTDFSYDQGSADKTISFAGRLFYEDLPADARQQEEWREARAEAYLGSVTHFFRALFNNQVDENSFVVYQVPDQRQLAKLAKKHKKIPLKYTQPIKDLSRFITAGNENFKTFNLTSFKNDSTELNVLYTPTREPRDFSAQGGVIERKFKMPMGQLSLLRLVGDTVQLSANGDVAPPNNLIKGGFWTWGKMAAFVPPDYELPPDLETRRMKRLKQRRAERLNKEDENN